jgi:endo-1,4-beta-xylanase
VIVNEALYLSDGNPYGLRSCPWLSTIGGDIGAGTDYVSEAFRAARRADPGAILVLNEYGVEDDTRDAAKKRDALFVLLQSLREKKLVDAIGLQSHLRGGAPFSAQVFDGFLARIDALGLKIVVTELDVIDADLPAQVAARDAAVAARVGEYLRVVLRHPSLIALNTWAFSDRETWYNAPGTPASLRRRDGLDSRPTLIDAGLHRKPVYYAVRDALDAAANA